MRLGPACDARRGKSSESHMDSRAEFEDEMRNFTGGGYATRDYFACVLLCWPGVLDARNLNMFHHKKFCVTVRH